MTSIDIVIYALIIAWAFSVGREKGFKKERLLNEEKHWNKISFLMFLSAAFSLVVGLATSLSKMLPTITLTELILACIGILILALFSYGLGRLSVPKGTSAIVECKRSIGEGKAVAAKICVFGAFVDKRKILLVRKETEWRLPGGEMKDEDTSVDFAEVERDEPFYRTLSRNSRGIGINLDNGKMRMIPACQLRYRFLRMAFAIIVNWESVPKERYYDKLANEGKVKFFAKEELKDLNIPPIIRWLAVQALEDAS